MNNLTPAIKAQAIAAAIYTATGIQPQVLFPEGKNPKIWFTRSDVLKLRAMVDAQLKKKSDVDIELIQIFAPAVIKKHWLVIAGIAVGLFAFGYVQGQMH